MEVGSSWPCVLGLHCYWCVHDSKRRNEGLALPHFLWHWSIGFNCFGAANASYLKLDSEGFTMCSMFRAQTFRWVDVTGFGVGRVLTNKMVMFNFEPTYTRTPGLRSFNVDLVGFEAGLPDSYGLKHDELAELLNKFKQASHGA
jgi:hypothetical protein